MNYVKQFMEDNGLKVGERFKVKRVVGEEKAFEDSTIYFESDYKLYVDNILMNITINDLLRGDLIVVKPAKTLTDKIRERGGAYVLNAVGGVTYFETHNIDGREISQGNVFLTESDAKREAFRRDLQFRMQEFAREHNEYEIKFDGENRAHYFIFDIEDLELGEEYSYCYKGSADFDVYFTSCEIIEAAKEIFENDIKKYYNWEG